MQLTLVTLCLALLCSPCFTQDSTPGQASQLGTILERRDISYHVRLLNATETEQYIYGALELSSDGAAWGHTCGEDVDRDSVHVICNMFGFSKGEGVAKGMLGHSVNPRFSSRFLCDSSDRTLDDCIMTSLRGSCSADDYIGVICFNDTRAVFDMRLVDGVQSATQISGRLEVRLTPFTSWGTVCDDSFNDRSATAACRFLGYKFGEEVTLHGWDWLFADTGAFGSGEQTFLDEVYCTEGQEFLDCEHDSWGQHDCYPSEDVGIQCMNTSVRLLSALPNDQAVGSVELYISSEGGWFEVCDENWDDNDAQVVCRELGFVAGKALTGNSLGLVSYGSLSALGSVTQVKCAGNEPNLNNCSMQKTDLCEFQDSVIDLAAVICYNKPVSQVNMTDAVRIVPDPGASAKVGYLEIRHLGVWGRVCEDRRIFEFEPMGDEEATVACRMAGYAGGIRVGSDTTDSTHHIWLRGMKCNGTESSIDECLLPNWGSPGLLDCNAPVRVLCYDNEAPKVVPSQAGAMTGYLGISLDGQLTSVCADNWTDMAASVACRDMGYSTGAKWTHTEGLNSAFQSNNALTGFTCKRSAQTFFDCITGGFGVARSQCVNGVAGFACYDDLKLQPVHGYTGVPQVYVSGLGWSTLCSQGFSNSEAKVVCRQLGHNDGEVVPPGAFGPITTPLRTVSCNGSETDVSQCTLTPTSTCSDGSPAASYATVSCYNVSTPTNSGQYRLAGGYKDNFTAAGLVQVWRHNTWGYACDESFMNNDAHTFCQEYGRSLGVNYQTGVKFSPEENVQGPFWLRRPACGTNMNYLANCTNPDYMCFQSRAASVICSTTEKAMFRLESETPLSGRVQVSVNGQVGAICADTWDDKAATVFCRQYVDNAVTGVAKFYERSNLPLYLSGVRCQGNEYSLMSCQNDGWRNVPGDCHSNGKEPGVICRTHVALTGGNSTSYSISGRLSAIRFSTERPVCWANFGLRQARMVCDELGFSHAYMLKAYKGGDFDTFYAMTIQECAESATRLTECRYTIGRCDAGQVRLLCSNFDVSSLSLWRIASTSQSPPAGPVVIEIADNFMGVICPIGFTDHNATKICQTKNSMYTGTSLGSGNITLASGSDFLEGREPVWFGALQCVGTSCTVNQTREARCFHRSFTAGVLCSNSGETRLRLMDRGRESVMFGRVEIMYQGVWGTICRSRFSSNDAGGVCKQLGYSSGTSVAGSPKRFGQGSGPIYLKDVQCDYQTYTILGCANGGWKRTDGCTHDDDLEVVCHGFEQLYPNPDLKYGAVASYLNTTVSSYFDATMSLVCSDGFGDAEAQVFCRGQGYWSGGAPICCSAMNVTKNEISITHLPISLQYTCQGNEPRLENCTKRIVTRGTCKQYASVACRTERDEAIPTIILDGTDQGLVHIRYYGADGLLCADGFNDVDATTVCRRAGYFSGLAFQRNFSTIQNASFYWASNLQCGSRNHYIEDCLGYAIGRTTKCQSARAAVVRCLGPNDDNNINVRLVGGGSSNRGRVEVQIAGQWGSLCLHDSNRMDRLIDTEANVLCRQLGFPNGGNILPPEMFANGSKVIIADVRCKGNESHIKDCDLLSPEGGHVCGYWAGVNLQCFIGAQLRANPPVNDDSHGILYIRKQGVTWHKVCDTAVTDREATVVCRSLGFAYGKAHCCNALGGSSIDMTDSVNTLRCQGNESDVLECTMSFAGTCSSKQYAYVHCSNTVFPWDGLQTHSMPSSYGNATVTRFGLTGGVCADGFGDKEATVMCRELGYFAGQTLHPFPTQMNYMFLLNAINCTGDERKIGDCHVPSLTAAGPCASSKAAMILCRRGNAKITARVGSQGETPNTGLAELVLDGRTMYVLNDGLDTDRVASVFCNSVGLKSYVNGRRVDKTGWSGFVSRNSILMKDVQCSGDESSLFDCQATYHTKLLNSEIPRSQLLYVYCDNGVELRSGPTPSSGIVTLYNNANGQFGAVCRGNFGKNEVDVACRQLGYEHGKMHCCMPFGFTFLDITIKDVKCSGSERSLHDCEKTMASLYSYYFCGDSQDYVGLTCYNETKPQVFNISIQASSAMNKNTGIVILNYLDVPGTICADNWDDKDAAVACKQLGYSGGSAYTHFFSRYSSSFGPFWTTNVNCQGTESTLNECQHTAFGEVTKCESGHYAALLCYEGSSLEYRISGSQSDHYGLVEVFVNSQWGTVCDIYWDKRDASVMCQTMGYVSGDVFDTDDLPKKPASVPAYELKPRCTGKETHINQCPHEGFTSGTSRSCSDHDRDAGVFCYTSVRLGTGSGKSFKYGPVNYYKDGTWVKVCDDGFTDDSARKVCQELGFFDGRAICCSAFVGESTSREEMHPNITMRCQGPESSVKECVKEETCNSDTYASVVCFEEMDTIDETSYTFSMKEDFIGAGRIEVTHLGVEGRICSNGWTDADAQVYCKSKNFFSGFAYQHSYDETYISASRIGPYWISNLTCNGTEASLGMCSFNDRHNMENCTGGHTAAAVCFQREGVKYRLAGGDQANAGRIEMAIDRRWGTVCSRNWQDGDSRVVCRSLGFTDGEAQGDDVYGSGDGPIWLSNTQCRGDESALHRCPHTGFENAAPDNGFLAIIARPCRTHSEDAAVFCYKDVRLNRRLGAESGALLYSPDHKTWQHVCNTNSFSRKDAQVACRSLMLNYVDGVPIKGGVFGDLETTQGVSSIDCTGTETTLSQCNVVANSNCSADDYISVACFKTMLTPDDIKFQVRLGDDSLQTSSDHGIVEIRQGGVWGRICMDGFSDTEASVACQEIGNFTGGTTYLHLYRNRLPMLWGKTTCSGDEVSLSQCQHEALSQSDKCGYHKNDAGVVCYSGEGVKYRLTGGTSPSKGRVEIGVDGDYGTVCAVNWRSYNSRVLCRSLGFVDGITSHDSNNDLDLLPSKFSFFLCEGDESNLLSCLNSGFDGGSLVYYCGGDAYAECYNEEIKITDIRIGDNGTTTGRVEVKVSGVEEWGTVCDDQWDDLDATVVCKYLGFDGGMATFDGHEDGNGKILLDNVQCVGNETSLSECLHIGINSHNCDHTEDAGVACFYATTAVPPKPTTPGLKTTIGPSIRTTKPATTTPRTQITTTVRPVTTKKPEMTTRISVTTKAMPTPNKPATAAPTAKPTTASNPTTTASEGDQSVTASSGKSKSSSAPTTIIVIVVVCSLLALVLAVILAVGFVRFRVRRKGLGGSSNGFSHKRFTNEDTLQRATDGSVSVSNQMYDITGAADTSFMAEDAEIRLGSSGLASYSKPPANTRASTNGGSEGFSNPLYAAREAALVSPTDVTMSLDGVQTNSVM